MGVSGTLIFRKGGLSSQDIMRNVIPIPINHSLRISKRY